MTRRWFLATLAGAAVAAIVPEQRFTLDDTTKFWQLENYGELDASTRFTVSEPCRLGNFRFPTVRGPIPLVYGGRIGQFGPNPFWWGIER